MFLDALNEFNNQALERATYGCLWLDSARDVGTELSSSAYFLSSACVSCKSSCDRVDVSNRRGQRNPPAIIIFRVYF